MKFNHCIAITHAFATAILIAAISTGPIACDPSNTKVNGEHQEGEHKEGEHQEGEHKEGEHKESVNLTPKALERSGIQVAAVSSGQISGALNVQARVSFIPDRIAHVSSLVEGRLTEISANVGDEVKAGDALSVLQSVGLGQARAELNRAQVLYDLAAQNLEREEKLHAAGINSERSLLESRAALKKAAATRDAARAQLRVFGARPGSGAEMTLTSPIDGVVIERQAVPGESVGPAEDLFVVADLSRVWVTGQVYEQQLAKVEPGMSAVLTLAAYPGRQWNGKIAYIGSVLDAESRTLPIRVELENPEGLLRPGLLGTLALAPNNPAPNEGNAVAGLHIPSGAVQQLEGRSVVFTPGEEPGEFHAVPVQTGSENQGRVEILDGLRPGQPVVVDGAFILKSELVRQELGSGHAH